MFFFLSKTLNYLLMPMVMICGCLVLSWVMKSPVWKKRLFIAGLSLLLLLSNEFIMNEVAGIWEVAITPFSNIKKSYAYGILLCGAARPDVGPKDRVYIKSAADRINHTLQLYKTGYIQKILISGGSGRLIDIDEREADELASLLRLMGVPDDAILIENRSRNTRESAVEVKDLLQRITRPEDCLLITSAYHMRRSLACFAKVGWPVDPFSVDFLTHQRRFTFDLIFIPSVEALSTSSRLFREWFGFIAYWIAGYV